MRNEARRVARPMLGEVVAGGSFLHFVGDFYSLEELDEKARVRLVASGVLGRRHRRVADRRGDLETGVSC